MKLSKALVLVALLALSGCQALGDEAASLTPAQVEQQISPNLSLEPLGGGGLFKMVQAPQRPGVQNWAAMLVHPDGVVTITKRVRVVSDRRELAR